MTGFIHIKKTVWGTTEVQITYGPVPDHSGSVHSGTGPHLYPTGLTHTHAYHYNPFYMDSMHHKFQASIMIIEKF